MARAALSAEVRQVQQPEFRILAALHAEVGDRRAGRRAHDLRRRAAQIEVGRVELRLVRGGVAVDRTPACAAAVGVDGQNGVTPVVHSVEDRVARGEVDPVGGRVVVNARARPHRRLDLRAVGRRRDGEMDGLVTAQGVEDFLDACGEVDRRHMPLVVAPIARIAAVGCIEV